MMGMTADKYIAKFEMLMVRTNFNEAALEDTFIWSLSQLILSKVYSQTSLLSGLDNWKTVMLSQSVPELSPTYSSPPHPPWVYSIVSS